MKEAKARLATPDPGHWVEVLGATGSGLVEFSYCVGSSDLCVQLLLPEAAFKEFCLQNTIAIYRPTAAQTHAADYQPLCSTFADAGNIPFTASGINSPIDAGLGEPDAS